MTSGGWGAVQLGKGGQCGFIHAVYLHVVRAGLGGQRGWFDVEVVAVSQAGFHLIDRFILNRDHTAFVCILVCSLCSCYRVEN